MGLLGQLQFLGGHFFSNLTIKRGSSVPLEYCDPRKPCSDGGPRNWDFWVASVELSGPEELPSLAFPSQKTPSHTSTPSLLTAWRILFFGFYPVEASAGHGSFPLLCLCPSVQCQAAGACFTGFPVYPMWKPERKMTNTGEM